MPLLWWTPNNTPLQSPGKGANFCVDLGLPVGWSTFDLISPFLYQMSCNKVKVHFQLPSVLTHARKIHSAMNAKRHTFVQSHSTWQKATKKMRHHELHLEFVTKETRTTKQCVISQEEPASLQIEMKALSAESPRCHYSSRIRTTVVPLPTCHTCEMTIFIAFQIVEAISISRQSQWYPWTKSWQIFLVWPWVQFRNGPRCLYSYQEGMKRHQPQQVESNWQLQQRHLQ